MRARALVPASPAAPGVAAPPQPPRVPAWRLVGTLAVAGALAGLLIVTVFHWAEPRIRSHQARVLSAAVQEVLGDPARTERLFLHAGALSAEPPVGLDTLRVERVFLGYDDAGTPVGFAVAGEQAGFQDVIRLIFGYDARTGRLLGMKVLESKETPGLGDKIEKDSAFVGSFGGAVPPIRGVKPGAGSGAAQEVDMITGATISSRAVIDIINRRIESVGPVLQAYGKEGGR